jgi:hypothetical protein
MTLEIRKKAVYLFNSMMPICIIFFSSSFVSDARDLICIIFFLKWLRVGHKWDGLACLRWQSRTSQSEKYCPARLHGLSTAAYVYGWRRKCVVEKAALSVRPPVEVRTHQRSAKQEKEWRSGGGCSLSCHRRRACVFIPHHNHRSGVWASDKWRSSLD